MQAMPIDWLAVFLPDGHVLLQHATHPQKMCRRTTLGLGRRRFEILHPDIASYNDETIRDNDRGCVLRISIGEQRILLTADIEKKSEARLINEHADKLFTTLLVVPHHGSKTSSTLEFITATLPDYAVFTVGYRNRFGHPKQEIVQRYADSGAELFPLGSRRCNSGEHERTGFAHRTLRETHRRYWTHVGAVRLILFQ